MSLAEVQRESGPSTRDHIRRLEGELEDLRLRFDRLNGAVLKLIRPDGVTEDPVTVIPVPSGREGDVQIKDGADLGHVDNPSSTKILAHYGTSESPPVWEELNPAYQFSSHDSISIGPLAGEVVIAETTLQSVWDNPVLLMYHDQIVPAGGGGSWELTYRQYISVNGGGYVLVSTAVSDGRYNDAPQGGTAFNVDELGHAAGSTLTYRLTAELTVGVTAVPLSDVRLLAWEMR